ncbi:enoyl-CoA hydratase/isomerase family protein [Collimonas pratensis]|uniref:enoyl-CoA hydratase/isomerase family protein n=1 Tax=Collimonas pratensis TaxID=279113 RepID=UPI00197D5775|nr:enoyl-CoA hydratase/isomerase family protein [Collimonas pratensis]
MKFNPGTLADFDHRFAAALNNEQNKVIVLTGGAACFSMGMDLIYISSAYDASFVPQFGNVLAAVRNSCKPVLAKVEGDVIAGGMALLAVADVILSSETASFSLPEASFGITPAIAMSCLLERVRPHHLKYLVWSSNVIAAKQALEWGVVDQISTPENLDRDTQALGRKLSRLAPSVIGESKMLLAERRSFEKTLNMGCQLLANKLDDPQAIKKIRRYLEDIKLFNDEYADE